MDSVAWGALFGVVVGSVIPGVFLLISQALTRRYEDRRHRRELAINAALSNWGRACEDALKASAVGRNTSVASLDHYIFHMVRLLEIVDDSSLTTDEVYEKLIEIRNDSRAAST